MACGTSPAAACAPTSILKEKARAFAAHAGIQALLAEIRGSGGELPGPYVARRRSNSRPRRSIATRSRRAGSPTSASTSCVVDLLLGVRLHDRERGVSLPRPRLQHAEPERRRDRGLGRPHVAWCSRPSLAFDEALPHYGTRHGVLPAAIRPLPSRPR